MATSIPATNWASSELQSIIPADQIDAVTVLVQESSDLSLQWYRKFHRGAGPNQAGASIENKAASGFDPVTEADRAVEQKIREGLEALFPNHAIIGEEFGASGDNDIAWIIDPIDGTRAFISGQPMWGTIVAVMVEGTPLGGWMHIPTLGETYVGSDETWWSDATMAQRISTAETASLSDAVLLCTHPSMFAVGPEADAFTRLDDQMKMTRYSGDCLNYGLLAMGLADLVVENQLAPYDIIPLLPIVEAAGGVVTDLKGDPPLKGGYVVAAATPELHAATLKVLNES